MTLLCLLLVAEPTAYQLIGTFLEKAECLPGQLPRATGDGAVQEERRVALVNCALLLGSLLHWNLEVIEKRLPTLIQCSLVSQLCNAYVQEGPLFSKESDTLMAHVIHSQWVLRFIYRHKHLPNLPSRSSTPAPEANSNSLEQIDSTTKPLVSKALDLLNGILSSATVPDLFKLPKVGVSLSTVKGPVEHLEPPDSGGQNEWNRPQDHVLCEISYTLGCYYFTQGDLPRASELFVQCHNLLSSIATTHSALFVNRDEVRGFLNACEASEGVIVENLAAELEAVKMSGWSDTRDILTRDFQSKGLPLGYRLCLERRALTAATERSIEEPPSKKMRREGVDVVTMEEGLTAYNGLREVMENKSPLPRFWQLCREREAFLDCVLSLCEQLLSTNLSPEERCRLKSFVRTLCVGGAKGGRDWERLLKSAVKEIASHKEQSVYRGLVSETVVPELVAMDSSSPLQTLDSAMCREVTAEATLTAVERLFKATPTNQHRAIAIKWVGVSQGFVPVESMTDPLTFTKYNILVHRGKTLKQAKSYSSSIEIFSCALKLLSPKTTPLSSPVRQGLEEWLREEILTLELLDTHTILTPDNVEKRLQSGELAPLIAKSKAYCLDGRHKSCDSVTSHLTNALLLNTQHYSFLFSRETQLEPGVIAPRLANCVHCVKEGRELRKPIRDLFDAVLTVFCPPLHAGEGKAETSERQSKLRANLDVFVENLMDTTSLSLLLAALVRVWNLLEKPEFEVLSEYKSHWPTAIGTPGSIDVQQVYRSLSTTIRRSLRLQPNNTSWLLMQAHLYCAKQDYGAALYGFLSVGSMASNHFTTEVPEAIWSPIVHQRLRACCTRLRYHTHSLIVCQLLEPVDYEGAFGIVRSNVGAMTEGLFTHLWDMTIIEYLIYTLTSKGDKHKQKIAMQVAGQPELNTNNSSEVLKRAAHVRRRTFLRTFLTEMTQLL
ncbi:integrator complex subunit 8-like isoform X2 [Halichondria panicea]|uniref:integrator complex subunit 8-like isoform X2 n=1 Tax=Halichondria panicea TaxID=6063 RepID=UPI00312BC51C